MPAWKFISKLEIHDRQVHISPDSTEIINTYYVEPASAGCVVTSALLGAVLFNGGLDVNGNPMNPTEGHRILPAADYQYDDCYCVDAYETMIHPDQAVGTASLLMGDVINQTNEWTAIRNMLSSPVILNGPQSLNSNFTVNSTDPTLGPRPGVYVRAVFRQLVTSYKYDNNTDSSYPDYDQEAFPFDYVDLRINPMSRIIPASAALYGVTNTGFGFGIAAQGAAEQVDSWLQVTIRRVMCPSINFQTIGVLKNKINGVGYTPTCFTVPGLNLFIPQLSADHTQIIGANPAPQQFPTQTLRFDDVVWEKKVIQSCIDQTNSTPTNIVILESNGIPYTQPMTWWNGELLFSWRTVLDSWYPATYVPNPINPGPTATPPNYGWVTWNCDWLPGGVGIDFTQIGGIGIAEVVKAFGPLGGGLAGLVGGAGAQAIRRYPTGWYELSAWQGMTIYGNQKLYDLTNVGLGKLYLQYKYWRDDDIRLRGGANATDWNPAANNWNNVSTTPGTTGDMLRLLQTLTQCKPFDLLFRMDAP